MIQEISCLYLFLPDEDFGSEDDDLGADDGKADSDYESSQKSKKGKKAKPEKNKRAASKSRKRPAGKKKKEERVASLCSERYCTGSLLGDYRSMLIRLNVAMFSSGLSYSASILINFLVNDLTFVLPTCYLKTVRWSVFCIFIITW